MTRLYFSLINRIKANFHIWFLIFFSSLAVYLRSKILNAPIIFHRIEQEINPLLQFDTVDILFSKYHRLIQIYRNAFSNLLYSHFGFSEITYRAFPILVSFFSLFYIYRFVALKIGRVEACISIFLFGISHYSLLSIQNPYYGGFYMFASFMTFYFLYQGFTENKRSDWFLFGLWNFLNVTNCILAGLYLLPIMIVGCVMIWMNYAVEKKFTSALNNQTKCMMLSFSASILLIIIMYKVREVDLLKQIVNLIFHKNGDVALGSDLTLGQDSSVLSNALILFTSLFGKLNFLYSDGGEYNGTKLAYGSYFCLFVLGLWALFKKNPFIISCFLAVFITPLIILPFILKISAARYIAFVLPFYLITVACGFVYLAGKLRAMIPPAFNGDSWTFILAFIFFSRVIQPGFLFSSEIIDREFGNNGIRAAADYIRENIKPEDIVLNATRIAELRGEVGDALVAFTHDYYLKQFMGQHRLEQLAERNGTVRVWLILSEPLSDKGKRPFYFPGTYSPEVVKKWSGTYLYSGEITIPDNYTIEKDTIFTTPFWSYLKARRLQLTMQFSAAEKYYQTALHYGFNRDRIYFNLGLMYINKSFEQSIYFFRKAIEALEPPKDFDTTSNPDPVRHFYSFGKDIRGFPDPDNNSQLRFYTVTVNGQKHKKLNVLDAQKYNPNAYVNYYMTPAQLLYKNYIESGKKEFHDESIKYFNKVLILHPDPNLEKIINKLKSGKIKLVISLKSNSFFIPYDLSILTDYYPPLIQVSAIP